MRGRRPASGRSRAATRYGIKWVSKNVRTPVALLASTFAEASHGVCQTDCVFGSATSARQPIRNAGQTASTESLFHPGNSVHAEGVNTGRGGAGGAGVGVGVSGGTRVGGVGIV